MNFMGLLEMEIDFKYLCCFFLEQNYLIMLTLVDFDLLLNYYLCLCFDYLLINYFEKFKDQLDWVAKYSDPIRNQRLITLIYLKEMYLYFSIQFNFDFIHLGLMENSIKLSFHQVLVTLKQLNFYLLNYSIIKFLIIVLI